ncbi:hypothetical protein CK203_035414 [Vitis vinifera]|uniref:30S ribosomal protein S15, chloroplastic n=1 Tax=Vitis vinifera TaxID=29760 RepID=A0A438I3R0_VITVI|nr:hypothetical protein CK203_035414 [Vitis vinifera]
MYMQYFHPDNMSSAEKLKVELKKVRDEFKMSESDCGSARVQVAQLTTKIKHLNSALHKKMAEEKMDGEIGGNELFELSVHEVKGKLLGKILESSRCYSSWIRFGELGLSPLLEEVELCCWGVGGKPFSKERLEVYSGGKEVCFVFPKGLWSSQPGGGVFILAEKVSSVGVAPQIIGWKVKKHWEMMFGFRWGKGCLSQGVPKVLSSGSVGGVFRYGDTVASIEEMCIFLLAFMVVGGWVLSKRHPCKGGKFLSPWDLNLDGPQSLLIPLPLEPGFKGMDKTLFKYLRDCHGGFVLVDISIVKQRNLQWARILVGSNDKNIPRLLQLGEMESSRRQGQKMMVVALKMLERVSLFACSLLLEPRGGSTICRCHPLFGVEGFAGKLSSPVCWMGDGFSSASSISKDEGPAKSLVLWREQDKGLVVECKGDGYGMLYVGSEEVVALENGSSRRDSMGDESLYDLSFGKFVSFSKFLDLLVEGYEKEIVSLLRKLEAKKGYRVVALSIKRRPSSMSDFDRELCKLECLVNYNKSSGKGGSQKWGWDMVCCHYIVVSNCYKMNDHVLFMHVMVFKMQDKHSRKGLQAMVQRRKKLLKYLRRTDWDSYCLVLSKLGLRDNPNYKN